MKKYNTYYLSGDEPPCFAGMVGREGLVIVPRGNGQSYVEDSMGNPVAMNSHHPDTLLKDGVLVVALDPSIDKLMEGFGENKNDS